MSEELTGTQLAAALHGSATNGFYPVSDRLKMALQALDIYETEIEVIRANLTEARSITEQAIRLGMPNTVVEYMIQRDTAIEQRDVARRQRDQFRDHYPSDYRLDYCVCGESWTENHDGRTP